MFHLLESVPWFVISAFAGSAAIAVMAGRGSQPGEAAAESGIATRTVGLVYAVSVAVVVGLWAREQL